ncbi:MAG: replication initiator protein [Microviridae sp.]|nr:MAG: replication initiator protein [Microviridae sp.]
MPCFHPLEGFHKIGGGLTFERNKSTGIPLKVPCGQCFGCRIDYSRMWAARLVHESRLHEQNMFVTLTYDPDCLPTGGTLVKRHLQLFFKTLRFAIRPRRIRYYACGEYGEQNLRPHYHIILFGHWFADAKLLREDGGHRFYTSDALAAHWGRGLSEFGHVTPETCAYTARYVTKKVTGDKAAEHYERVNPITGELYGVIPEFAVMSRRPGIARDFYDRYRSDIYPDDFVILNGHRSKVPRYYDRLLEAASPSQHLAIKTRRIQRARRARANNTPERLAERETCLKAKISISTRNKTS